jgi:uracil-DNA glycosylase family 4
MNRHMSAHDEALDLIAAAREALVDLLEEGVDALPRVKTEEFAAPATTTATANPSETSRAPSTSVAADAGQPSPTIVRDEPARPTHASASASESDATPSSASWSADPTLDEVRSALGECTRCGLCEGRQTIVFGSGNPNADILFIGEGPGEQEDRQGLPFVGRAGELLTKMIEGGIKISRDDVYICNIVKCRPPENRNPLPDEVSACRPFLDGQIDAVKPRVIVSLGKPAASLLLGREVPITRIRGTWHEYRGIPLMPTLHPAYVLRQYTPENRRNVWEDLKQALERSRG